MRDKNRKYMDIEDVLQDSHELKQMLMESFPNKIFFKNRESVYMFCNSHYAADIGIAPDEIRGKTDYDFHPRDLADKYRTDDQRIIKSGKLEQMEESYRIGDEERTVLTVKTPVRDENGNVIGIMGIFNDITEQKRIEEKLKQSEQKYRTLVETTQEGICIDDKNDNITFTNKAFADMLGYKRDEIIGMNFRELMDKRQISELERQTKMRTEGKSSRYEIILYTKDGKPCNVIVSAAPLVNVDGNYKGSISVNLDITKRKKAEEEREYQKNYFQALFKDSPEGIVSLDDKHNVIDINPALEEMFGYHLKDLQGKEIDDYIIPERFLKEGKEYTKRTLSGKTVKAETIRKRKDGSEIPVSMLGAPIFIGDKEIGSFGIYRDITERKKAEEKIKHLNLVLHAIRNVNQLIAKEKNRGRLLREICDSLIETRGYNSAWIALFDENKKFIASVEAGLGKDFVPLKKLFKRGEMIECGRRALKRSGVVVVKDFSACVDCPLLGKVPSEKEITVRLEHKGKIFGLISVSVPAHLADDKEEHGLFKEVAGDIAFALHDMESEEKHKQAERSLKESEEKFRLLAESTASAIFIYQDDVFKYANPAMERILGHSKDDIIGMKFWDVVHPDDIKTVRERGQLREEKGEVESYLYEFRVITKDGKTKWIDFAGASIIYEGKPAGLGTAYDITERKKAYEEIERVLEQERVFKSKTAHYFFNPIAIAKGYIDLTMDEVPNELKEKLKSARHAIMRVETVVKNVVTKGEVRE